MPPYRQTNQHLPEGTVVFNIMIKDLKENFSACFIHTYFLFTTSLWMLVDQTLSPFKIFSKKSINILGDWANEIICL